MSENALQVGSKFKTTAVGIVTTGKPSWAEWECALSVTASILKSSPFWLGDMLNYGEHHFGEKYTQAINDLGMDPGYLRNVAYVCGRVELSLRSDKLTFSHHQLVAPCDPEDQKKWITLAANNKWTVAQLREAMKGEEEPGEAGDAPEEGDELAVLIREIEEYLDGLADNHARSTALEAMLRKIKALAAKYREGGRP